MTGLHASRGDGMLLASDTGRRHVAAEEKEGPLELAGPRVARKFVHAPRACIVTSNIALNNAKNNT